MNRNVRQKSMPMLTSEIGKKKLNFGKNSLAFKSR
jgi:hypothetical protein